MNEENLFICVIDDESSIRESLSNLLRSAGLKVQVFASAQEFIGSEAYHFEFSDRKDGFEATPSEKPTKPSGQRRTINREHIT
jgi:hypothetical protein